MIEEIIKKKLLPITFILVLFLLTVAVPCKAQEWSRRGRTELYGVVQNMSGDSASGSGVLMKLGSTSAIGLGYGSNLNDHLNLNIDVWLGSTNVTGQALGVIVNGDTSLLGFDLNMDICLLSRRLTPVVTGGFGFISLSGNVEGFPFDETDISYNFGGGLRWDATDHLFFKALYKFTKTKLEETDKAITLDGATLHIGYMF